RRRGRRDRPGRAVLMTRVSVDLIDTLAPMVETRVREAALRLPDLRYADVRLEVTEGKGAGAENGTPKYSGDDYGFALGARVLAGDRILAPGRRRRFWGQVQLRRDDERALARALRVERGRADRPVVRAHPGLVHGRHRRRRGESRPLRRARAPARLGDPARRRRRAGAALPDLRRLRARPPARGPRARGRA